MSRRPGSLPQHAPPMPAMLLALVALLLLSSTAHALSYPCAGLAQLNLPHTSITLAEPVRVGAFTPPGAATALTTLPPFCRVAASLHPSPDSDIRVELWLPLTAWNHRLNGTGNGGFAGKVSYTALADGLRLGYAVANTDMGLATPPGQTAAIFAGRPERWRDWGFRSTHEMTVFARSVIAAFYGQPPRRAYFTGCSTGGEQALMEAQRFPDDYDGIVGGAPANNRTGVHISILWNFAALRRDPAAYLPAPQLAALSASVHTACPSRPDGLLEDPLHCTPNPAPLRCGSTPGAPEVPACLSAPQLHAAQAIYAGPANPRTEQTIYPGLLPGSELAWSKIASDPPATAPDQPLTAPFAPIFQWVFGTSWDWHAFDFDRDADTMTRQLAPMLNATSPDLDAFRAHGGKLLTYHGAEDWLVPTGESVRYRDAVLARDHNLHLGPLDRSFRLFLVPEMQHCTGPTPATIDTLGAMVEWVEHAKAPDTLLQTLTPVDAPTRETLLCPYPALARYRGTGDLDRAASYACITVPASLPRDSPTPSR